MATENPFFPISYSQNGTCFGHGNFSFQAKYERKNEGVQKGAGRNAAASQEQTIPL